MFPYYLLADVFMLWMFSFLSLSFLIAFIVIIRAFRSPYQDRKDAIHYEGMKRMLVREAESLARGLANGE